MSEKEKEKEKAICTDATGDNGRAVCSIDSVASGVLSLGEMDTVHDVMPVGGVIIGHVVCPPIYGRINLISGHMSVGNIIIASLAIGLVIIVTPLLVLGTTAYKFYKRFNN